MYFSYFSRDRMSEFNLSKSERLADFIDAGAVKKILGT